MENVTVKAAGESFGARAIASKTEAEFLAHKAFKAKYTPEVLKSIYAKCKEAVAKADAPPAPEVAQATPATPVAEPEKKKVEAPKGKQTEPAPATEVK